MNRAREALIRAVDRAIAEGSPVFEEVRGMTAQADETAHANRWVVLFWAAKRVLRKQGANPDADLEAAVEAIEQHDITGETH